MSTAAKCRTSRACACLVRTAIRLECAFVLVAMLAVSLPRTQANSEPPAPSRERPISGEVADKLRATISNIEFDGLALEESFRKLSEACGVSIQPDWAALAALRIAKDTEVNLKCSNARARQVLSLLLREVPTSAAIDLGYFQEGSVIRVTTGPSLFRRDVPKNVDELLITVRPPSNSPWAESGPDEVLPSQRLASWTNVEPQAEKEGDDDLPREKSEVEKKLNMVVPSLVFQGERFDAALEKIASLSGLKIEPNWSALESQAIDRNSRFSLRLGNVRFDQAIGLVLNEVGQGEVDLKYYVDGEVIRVTAKEPTRMTKTPNIEDLLITIPPNAQTDTNDSDADLPHEAAEAAFEKRLLDTVPELVFQDVTFESALEKLATVGGLNIVPNWSALEAQAIEKENEVHLRLKNEQLGRSLQMILDEVGGGEVELGYVVDGTVVRVSTIEDLSRIRMLVIYNVGDLVRGADPESLFIPAEHNNDAGWLMQDQMKAISQLITETVDPESWREAGGNVGTIKINGDNLVIVQCKSAHLEIKKFLQDLRDERHNQPMFLVDAEIVRVSASVDAYWRQTAAANFPSFSQEEYSKLRLNTQGISRLTRASGMVQASRPLKFESYWQQATSDPSREGTYFGVTTSMSFYPISNTNVIRFRVNLELVGPVDLPAGSSAVTGPQDVSPVNWKAAGVKTWQVRRVSTVVTVKQGEAIALMIPPENPGQMDGSSSDWILIQPRIRK